MKKKIIILTLNPKSHLEKLLYSLSESENLTDLIFLDSSSDDGSTEYLASRGFDIYNIKRSNFDHGGTRNFGARLAGGQGTEILVFMTQDANPANNRWLEELVAPIVSGEAVATFARQLPRRGASLLEQFSRYFNYPNISRLRDESDIERMGVKAFFFSNVCSAVQADIFWKVGGFPEHVIMNEDMTLAAKLLRAGYKIKYVAESEVIHSHDYTLKQQFRRNFDVGAFFAEAGQLLSGASVSGEGLRFVHEQMRYVLRHGRVELLPLVFIEAATKLTAFQLGKRHRFLPISLKKKLSMHSYHWDQTKEKR
ncbi:glycosyltransferase family 2 protein [Deinococcus irradiatisoli]|uniref:Glycosyltransferase family 2 protein n=1 Tax=Deinococcus irradiatisoli TaxID=2202254 RepID=A0A2Z3JCW5_9DEIO|nr:glycosyltransferase [Deinococcus irradiatisoli]AWN23013.1 glycosyltransferase family 2 protein [Deinococcus irradiatisoli]